MKSRFARSSGCFRVAASAVLLGLATFYLPCVSQAQTPPPPPPPPEVQPPTTTPPTQPGQTPPPPPPEAGGPPASTPPTTPAPGAGGRYLLLPDISLNAIFKGHFSSDKRDQTRDKLRLDQAELAIQSTIYPAVRWDTFIVFAGEGGVNVEESFVTFQNVSVLRQQLTAVVGRRKVSFGRVNQLHPHSWLYIVQPYVLSNLVSPESLTGDGGYLSYLLPTGKIFSQLDLGLWSQSEAAEEIPTPPDPTSEITPSTGAGFQDKFATARLHLATEAFGGSAELGGSLAGGRGVTYSLDEERSVRPDILLSGLDFTFRRSSVGAKRLLLRAEYFQHRQKDSDFKKTTNGWYAFADQRLDPYTSVGLRYDSSGFPYAPGRESGVSLIATRQLTEVTLFRAQYIHGNRPGMQNFNELHLELIVGAGPHTHNLE